MSVPPNSGSTPHSYITEQEMKCVLHWFLGWTASQRERFLQDLVCKAVPGKVCSLELGLEHLVMADRPPSIFQCQLRLWDQWFQSWAEDERNMFLHRLEEADPSFVARFYQEVAGTAGKS
uniref:Uncharacterized protein C14orf119 homolog n=1 Tax=Geotrypetes seraphini TaxID=260995 RepID=A0A6P8NV84_GEOSA|nr:uncharacterized protein C14orf119 homolog [Geotrypetes seraphini]XP_033780304.1 uncharacterized protein C14orf119 homolog [Geotrypetes seraphini]XP_033780305.1 uncharacterized protein C14orf119 homolog [Geotrypetes seraphini]XP_033780307.1 uncharacterized protein C14orf119 homolog [Geotrypetes seraphini]XP_033780308.1 uncharacterized protein C14orf119 homolog [Geotrypetes seraphini]